MLSKMLTEFSSTMANKKLRNIKNSDPEEYEEVLKMFLTASEVVIHFLHESPEFRDAFSRVHNEFMKYPECRASIEQALEAYQKYGDK